MFAHSSRVLLHSRPTYLILFISCWSFGGYKELYSCCPNTAPFYKAAQNVKYSNQHDQVDVDLERKNLDYALLSNVWKHLLFNGY